MAKYTEIPEKILVLANKDKYLKDEIDLTSKQLRVAIYHENTIVGFLTPETTTYKGQRYWRTGAVYVLPEYRSKGLGSKAIMDFFEAHEYGMAYIEPTNFASMRAFEKAGFVKEKEISGKKHGEIFNLMIKRPATKPAFTRW